MKKDYYRTLGVGRGASQDDIRKGFYRLAHRFHPDKNAGDRESEERFKEINEAYTVLSDPSKKARYDTFGHSSLDFQLPPINIDQVPGAFLFRKLGKALGFRFTSSDPDDVHINVLLSLEDMVFGTIREIGYRHRVECPHCMGTGDRNRALPLKCPVCGGSGGRPAIPGLEGIELICRLCKGYGFIPRRRCTKCDGSGTVEKREKAKVSIPAGVTVGEEISIHGAGHWSRGGGTGSLIADILVKPHPVFRRNGLDLLCEVVIPRSIATKGTTMDVPGLRGTYSVRIPAGTEGDQLLRLAGKGLQDRNGAVGDLLVKILLEPSKAPADAPR